MSFFKLVAAAAATIALYGTWKAIVFLTRPWRSHLRYLPGPKHASLMWGNMKQIQFAESQSLHEEWVNEYGTTFKYKGFFLVCHNTSNRNSPLITCYGTRNLQTDRLCTMDLRALNHVLTHSIDYQKPAQARFNLSRLLGNGASAISVPPRKCKLNSIHPGILVTEGDKHKQQV
jgi:hypothetical protein